MCIYCQDPDDKIVPQEESAERSNENDRSDGQESTGVSRILSLFTGE